jgi:thiamine monophosphate kinase
VTSEHERIAELTRIFASGRVADGDVADSEIRVGIGDDAAVLSASGAASVLSVDAQVDDVHFRRAWMSMQDIGHRALASALSDLAAMCARPRAALCAWSRAASPWTSCSCARCSRARA